MAKDAINGIAVQVIAIHAIYIAFVHQVYDLFQPVIPFDDGLNIAFITQGIAQVEAKRHAGNQYKREYKRRPDLQSGCFSIVHFSTSVSAKLGAFAN